jgi:hypothetical protein
VECIQSRSPVAYPHRKGLGHRYSHPVGKRALIHGYSLPRHVHHPATPPYSLPTSGACGSMLARSVSDIEAKGRYLPLLYGDAIASSSAPTERIDTLVITAWSAPPVDAVFQLAAERRCKESPHHMLRPTSRISGRWTRDFHVIGAVEFVRSCPLLRM